MIVSQLFICDEETGSDQTVRYVQIDGGGGSSYTPPFIAYTPLMDLTGPAAYRGYRYDFTVTCVYLVQARPFIPGLMVVFSSLQIKVYCLFCVAVDFKERASLFLHHR